MADDVKLLRLGPAQVKSAGARAQAAQQNRIIEAQVAFGPDHAARALVVCTLGRLHNVSTVDNGREQLEHIRDVPRFVVSTTRRPTPTPRARVYSRYTCVVKSSRKAVQPVAVGSRESHSVS